MLLSPGARAAGTVALERNRGTRVRRLVRVGADAIRERRRPKRPRMRSLVLLPGGRLSWRSTATPPPPGALAAVVAPVAMATCDLDRPIGLGTTPFPLPLHLGHECVGRVLSVGSKVKGVRPGDLVAVPFQISCGRCAACKAGFTGNCRTVPPISMYGFGAAGGAWGGAFSEQVAVPYADAMLVKLPAGVDPVAVASVGDTLSDAYRHVEPHLARIRKHPGIGRVIIVGSVRAGTLFGSSMPLYAALILRALAPKVPVLLVEARPWMRAEADRLGVDAIPPAGLGRRQAALVIDSSADPQGLRLALAATAPDGVCSCAGSLHASVRVPTALMFGRNVTLSVARSHIRTVMPKVLDLVASGRLRPELVTTRVAPFDAAPEAIGEYLRKPVTKTVLTRSV